MAHYRSRRRSSSRNAKAFSPVIGFLLIACFGILFAGCSSSQTADDEYVFTAEDAAKFHELAQQVQEDDETKTSGSGSVSSGPYIAPLNTASGALNADIPVLDLSMVKTYQAVRTGAKNGGPNMFRVTNEFLNVRSAAATNAATVSTLNRGDVLEVIGFENARWAKVKVGGGVGYVSTDYIARTVSEEKLAEEKKVYEGQSFVNFKFVNMRTDTSVSSEKIAEIPGQTILVVKQVKGDWSLVSYQGKDGYVSNEYLKPFLPNFLVRQDSFKLPVIQFRLGQAEILKNMPDQLAKLKAAGVNFMTMRDFSDLLLKQEQRDTRLNPNSAAVAVTGITASNVKEVSDALQNAGVKATLFIQTKNVGINGITEKMILTLLANGFDLQSAAHTGDDLRSLTNSQIELELKQSRQLLEQYTKRSVFAIAYPQGGANDRVMDLAASAGYLLGITTDSDNSFTRDQLLQMPSFAVFPTTSADELVRAVKGS